MPDRRVGLPFTGPRRPPSHLNPPPRPAAPQESSVVAWGWYVDGVRQDCEDLAHATSRAKVGDGWVWLGLKDPDNEDMEQFARSFELHPLAIEDAVEGHTRSKVEQFENTLFAVVSTVAYVDHDSVTASSEIVSTGQIMVFVGPGFAMTVRRGEHAGLSGLRRRMENEDPELLAMGPSSVLYGVMDKITDDYLHVVGEFETDIEEIETVVFSRQRTHEIEGIYQLKRELIEFKRSVVPLGAPLLALATRAFVQVPEDMRAYFRELSDHHLQARESIQSFNDVLDALLSASLTRASVEDNQDMRKISAAVAILAVPTMIFGWYGMNFRYMPELEQPWGYPVVLLVTLVLMLVVYRWFHKNRWL